MKKVVVFAENNLSGEVKKSSLEAAFYASKIFENITVVTVNSKNCNILSKYGASNVINFEVENMTCFDAKLYLDIISENIEFDIFILPSTLVGNELASFLSTKNRCGFIANVINYPSKDEFPRKVFSSKAVEWICPKNDKFIISLEPNSIEINEVENSNFAQKNIKIDSEKSNIKFLSRNNLSNKINLKEAKIVISAGRGLKLSENWAMIEELADLLGGALACSKPVSDMNWRSHSEHVGQTGKVISPDLYIAIGISGAIQHLAGVSNAKNIIAINIDSEAPIMKLANYAVVADAFEFVPNLIEKIKKTKS